MANTKPNFAENMPLNQAKRRVLSPTSSDNVRINQLEERIGFLEEELRQVHQKLQSNEDTRAALIRGAVIEVLNTSQMTCTFEPKVPVPAFAPVSPPVMVEVPTSTSASAPPPVKKTRLSPPMPPPRPPPPPTPPRPNHIKKQAQQVLSPVFNRTRLTENSDDEDEDGTQGPDEFPPTPPPPQRSSASLSGRPQNPSFRSAAPLQHSIQSIANDYYKIHNPQPAQPKDSRGTSEPKFAYKPEKPVRKKEERKKLPGWDCPTCRNYYEGMASQMEPRDLEKLRNKCSKHRSKLPEPDYLGNTPRYFWDLDFPSTQECLQNGLIQIGERSQRK